MAQKKRMTDKWRCSLLITWMRRRGVVFRVHKWRPRTHLKSGRLYRAASGQMELRGSYTKAPLIRVWCPADGYRNAWRDLINCIIHEYGHAVLARVPHTEREAWAFGRRAVPAQYVPTNYGERRKRSLATYGQAADRRLACASK